MYLIEKKLLELLGVCLMFLELSIANGSSVCLSVLLSVTLVIYTVPKRFKILK